MTATITTNANDFYAAFARVALATDKKDQRGRQMDHVAGQIQMLASMQASMYASHRKEPHA